MCQRHFWYASFRSVISIMSCNTSWEESQDRTYDGSKHYLSTCGNKYRPPPFMQANKSCVEYNPAKRSSNTNYLLFTGLYTVHLSRDNRWLHTKAGGIKSPLITIRTKLDVGSSLVIPRAYSGLQYWRDNPPLLSFGLLFSPCVESIQVGTSKTIN